MSCRDPDYLALNEQIAATERAARGPLDLYADNLGQEEGRHDAAAVQARTLRARAATLKTEYQRDIRLISIAAAQTATAAGLNTEQAAERLDAILYRHTNGRTTSRTETTAPERAAILAEFKAGGWRPKAATGARHPRPGEPKPAHVTARAQLAKVRAQLTELGKPWSYAEAILRGQRRIKDPTIACPVAQATDGELANLIGALARTIKSARRRAPTPGAA